MMAALAGGYFHAQRLGGCLAYVERTVLGICSHAVAGGRCRCALGLGFLSRGAGRGPQEAWNGMAWQAVDMGGAGRGRPGVTVAAGGTCVASMRERDYRTSFLNLFGWR